MYNKILIAVDNSSASREAARRGLELADMLNAEVALIFVIDVALTIGQADSGITPEQALKASKEEAESTLEQMAGLQPSRAVTRLMPQGHPKQEIINAAEEWGAQLIVMATHGRTGIGHLLMGSVAEAVLRHAKVPVLVVPLHAGQKK